MAERMKLTITLWTNRPICQMVTDKGTVHVETQINGCTQRRYNSCAHDKRCDRFAPTCEMDKRRMLGQPTAIKIERTPEQYGMDQKQIDEMLEKEWKKCREYIMTIEKVKI